ncbi:hypothetical protein BCU26_004265 [Vibrio splendidus]|uniref:hypothetical protein n=1 Tax=Vibrio splendidus TaxID=29497 RepID=UPI000C844219|nr:hypothetical protein [Vibrio splendidus]MCC4786852.1 hypothetical protein [Vibrio splendidus]MDH5935720.1 hypothetical protein [Vibrio splendidus]MDH5975453.1 hypothetical protein [Vibrio splendidus]MDP2592544.1 hypothetical protein [Vibrio splendidus]PMH70295.1 hypothetical protein BCU61_09765 [Vibrio splendidus]
MNNKISLSLLTVLLSSVAVSANASVKLGMGVDQGLGMNLKLDDTFNIFAGNNGMAFDYHVLRGNLSASTPLSYFVGVGGYYEWDDDFGMRVPVGLDWSFASNWNLYGQVNPELQFHSDTKFKFGAGFGVSYKF